MGVAIAGAAIAAVGVISGFLGAKKAEKAAKRAAREEARLEGIVTGEKLRQLGIEARVFEGQQIASYAGSGVKTGIAHDVHATQVGVGPGSPADILKEQRDEFGRIRKVTEEVGATKMAQSLTRGTNIANAYRYQGYSQSAAGIANIFAILKTR